MPTTQPLTVYAGAPDRTAADVPEALPTSGQVTMHAMNCRGLHSSPTKRRQLRPLISRSPQIQTGHIVCLSETVLSGDLRSQELPAALAQQYADDIGPQCRSSWTGHCGILVGPALDSWDLTTSTALNGRAVVATLTEPDTGTVTTVVSIYAPVDKQERRRWLCDLHRLLVGLDRVIIMGDWNFVPDTTSPYDRLGGGDPDNVGHSEWAAMSASDALDLTEVLSALHDTERNFGDLTWRSPKGDGRIMRRLDWMAASTDMLAAFELYLTTPPWFTKHGTDNVPGTDHSTITATCRLACAPTEPPSARSRSIQWATARTRIDTSDFLSDMEDMIRAAETRSLGMSDAELLDYVDVLHSDIGDLYGDHAKAVAVRHDHLVRRAKRTLDGLLAANSDPVEWAGVCEDILAAQDAVRLAVERDAKAEQLGRDRDVVYNARHQQRTRPTDNTTQRTFAAQRVFRPSRDEHTLDNIADPELRRQLDEGPGWTTPPDRPAADTTAVVDDPDIKVVRNIDHMLRNTRLFYSHLYRKSSIHEGCQQKVFDSLPTSQRLRPEAVRDLNAGITVQEVIDANTGRSCGPDGFCSELYRHCPQLWAPLLHRFYCACFRLKHVSASMRGGLIALLFKGGGKDPQDLGNWRPVTKLERKLCIIEAVFKRRLSPHMATVTSQDQSSGAPGRDMLHTLTTILDAVDYAASPPTGVVADLQSLHMILLDGRKAFDMADREYMVRLIAWWLGFDIGFQEPGSLASTDCCDFITWIRILIGNVGPAHQRQVMVNGQRTDLLDLFSGCPQGSVLAALLYNCGCIEGLSALLRRAALDGLQIRRPDGTLETLTNRIFADDTTLFLRTRSLNPGMDCVDVQRRVLP